MTAITEQQAILFPNAHKEFFSVMESIVNLDPDGAIVLQPRVNGKEGIVFNIGKLRWLRMPRKNTLKKAIRFPSAMRFLECIAACDNLSVYIEIAADNTARICSYYNADEDRFDLEMELPCEITEPIDPPGLGDTIEEAFVFQPALVSLLQLYSDYGENGNTERVTVYVSKEGDAMAEINATHGNAAMKDNIYIKPGSIYTASACMAGKSFAISGKYIPFMAMHGHMTKGVVLYQYTKNNGIIKLDGGVLEVDIVDADMPDPMELGEPVATFTTSMLGSIASVVCDADSLVLVRNEGWSAPKLHAYKNGIRRAIHFNAATFDEKEFSMNICSGLIAQFAALEQPDDEPIRVLSMLGEQSNFVLHCQTPILDRMIRIDTAKN